MTLDELRSIKELLNMLEIKTKTDALHYHVRLAQAVVDREIKFKTMDPVTGNEKTTLSDTPKDTGV